VAIVIIDNPSIEQINEVLKPGVTAQIDFESKRFDGIYYAKGTISRHYQGLVGFSEVESNYPPGMPVTHGINETRIRRIEILD
jgi:hypothetical protein